MRLARAPKARRFGLQDGFSLIEVLIAALLLAAGVGTLLYVFANAGKRSQTAAQQDVAAAIATNALEAMRTYPYASLSLNGSVLSLPDSRLVNSSTFQWDAAVSNDTEPLDTATLSACSTTITTSCSPFAPTSTGTLGGYGYTIYRVISWDNQSCPINAAAVNTLNTAVTSLYTAISKVETLLTNLNGGGSTGISNAISHLSTVILSLLPGALKTAFTKLSTDLTTLSGLVSGTVSSGLQHELTTVNTDLTTLGVTSSGLTSTEVQTLDSIDLCHLTDITLPDPTALTSLATGLVGSTGSAGVYANLSSAQTDVTASAGYTVLTPSGTVTSTDTDLSTQNGTITADMQSSGTVSSSTITSAATSLSNLATLLTCVSAATCSNGAHEAKRISVAVVLNTTRHNVGPTSAVWMSSVLSNPIDGLG